MATSQGYQSQTTRRILKELAEFTSNPSPSYHASPLSDSDLLQWHFTVRGPPSSPYSTGLYHGRIDLPPNYPFAPPSFRFLTPSGRFEANRPICLSISGHHEESWQPAWGIRTALVALRSFMETEARGQLGGLDFPEQGRRRLAGESRMWRCRDCGKRNDELLTGEGEDGEMKKEEVPEELRMQYRDQLGKAKEKTTESDASTTQPMNQPPSTPSAANSSQPLLSPTISASPANPHNAPNSLPIDATSLLRPNPERLAQLARQRSPSLTGATDGSAHSENNDNNELGPDSTERRLQAILNRAHAEEGDAGVQTAQMVGHRRDRDGEQDDQASAWLDNAIIGVGAMLGFMLFKKAFGIELL